MEQQLTEQDYQMADYIRQILKLQQVKVWSWGTHDCETIKDGLQFKVQGFLMTGTVKVTYDEGMDLFDIEFLPDDDKPRKAILGLYLDQIVDTIDRHVEYDENYMENLTNEYGLIITSPSPGTVMADNGQ